MRSLSPALALFSVAFVAFFAERPVAPAAQADTPAVRFTVTDLGQIPKARVVESMLGATAPDVQGAMALNDRGQVVGGFLHAFLWDRGRVQDLGTLPGDPQDTQSSAATAINNRGQVVGTSGTYEFIMMDSVDIKAFLYTNKALHYLARPGQGDQFEPSAINDAGQIVGYDRNTWRGFFYAKGKLITLGTFSKLPNGNSSTATGLNRQGQVVGSSTTPGPNRYQLPTHAFLWQRGGGSGGKSGSKSGRMRDLGTLPGWADSRASAINGRGEVIGTLSDDADGERGGHPEVPPRAFLWRAGKMTDLGTLPGCHGSEAYSINDAGAVVGQSDGHAFLWENGTMRDLSALVPAASGWALSEARAINNRGQIAGSGTLGGQPHAFLLTPR